MELKNRAKDRKSGRATPAKQKRRIGGPDLHESERALNSREDRMGSIAHHGCKLGVGSCSSAGPARNRWQGWPPAAAAARGEEEALKRSTRAASVISGRPRVVAPPHRTARARATTPVTRERERERGLARAGGLLCRWPLCQIRLPALELLRHC